MRQSFSRRSSYHQEGFTLIELMIVVAIIGGLAMVAVPNFISYRDRSRVATAMGTANSMRTALSAFVADDANYLYPATIDDYTAMRTLLNPLGLSLPQNAAVTGIASLTYTATTGGVMGAPVGSDYSLIITTLASADIPGHILTVTSSGITKGISSSDTSSSGGSGSGGSGNGNSNSGGNSKGQGKGSALYTSHKSILDRLLTLNESDGRWPVVGAINQVPRLSSSRLIRDVYNDEG